MQSKIKVLLVGLASAVTLTSLVVVNRSEQIASRPLASMWAALGGIRPIEGRIVGPTAYARYEPRPVPAPRRGPSDGRMTAERTESIELLRTTADLFEEHARRPSTETARRVAGAALLRGDAERAVAGLNTAQRDAPENAALWSDLAAAYLEQSRVEDRPVLLVEALECAERAVELDGALLEAHFNRAVILERLYLGPPARAAWTDYLALDPGSGWAAEALARVEVIDKPPASAEWPAERGRLVERAQTGDWTAVREVTRAFPHFCRMLVRNDLFAAWADATREGRGADAALALETCRAIGAELAALQGDLFVRDAVAAIDRGSEVGRAAIVEGHDLNRQARSATNDERFTDAERLYDRAAASFARGGDTANRLASQRNQADAGYNVLQGPKALLLVLRVRDEAAALGYPQIEGIAWWLVGTIRVRERKLDEAERAYEAARARLETAGFVEGVAAMHTFLGEIWTDLGQEEQACRHLLEGLRKLQGLAESSQRPTILHDFAAEVAAQDRLRAALAVQDESLRIAAESGDAFDTSSALQQRALLLARLGQLGRAADDLAAARARVGEIPDAVFRQRIEGDILLAEVEIGVIDDPATAVDACGRVQEIYAAADDQTRLLQSLRMRARSHLRIGNVAAAAADLRTAVDEVLRVRDSVSDVERRVSYLNAPMAIFDEMIAFQFSVRSDAETALAFSEASRARGLLDVLAKSGGEAPYAIGPASIATLRERLAPDCVLVEYAWTDRQLFAWTVDREGVTGHRLETPSDLRQTIAAYRDALGRGRWDESTERMSQDLYDALVRPLGSAIGEKDLVVVPDKMLWDVPFATLLDRADGTFLVERNATTTAPSAKVYLHMIERDKRLARSGDPASALVFGNPTVDVRLFPDLRRLESAEREARAVADLYPASKVAIGDAATKEAFVRGLGEATVVHFAGHALSRGESALEPGLLFASESRSDALGDALLSASEISRFRLSRTRLAVLAGCRTGEGARVGREGNLSVARALLVAGVPCVAATHWDADDRVAAFVLTEFHRRLRAGEVPGRALRSALVSALNATDPETRSPAAWGAFFMLGGHS